MRVGENLFAINQNPFSLLFSRAGTISGECEIRWRVY